MIKSPGVGSVGAYISAGSFTGTLTGMTGGTTGTVNYSLNGNQVTLTTYVAITGTSNTTGMTMTGLPVACQPVHAKNIIMFGVEDNGNPAFISGGAMTAGGSVITFYLGVVAGAQVGGSASNFTASGTKGLSAGWTTTYTID